MRVNLCPVCLGHGGVIATGHTESLFEDCKPCGGSGSFPAPSGPEESS